MHLTNFYIEPWEKKSLATFPEAFSLFVPSGAFLHLFTALNNLFHRYEEDLSNGWTTKKNLLMAPNRSHLFNPKIVSARFLSQMAWKNREISDNRNTNFQFQLTSTSFSQIRTDERRTKATRPSQICVFDNKNNSFSRFASAFFLFVHSADVLVLSTS